MVLSRAGPAMATRRRRAAALPCQLRICHYLPTLGASFHQRTAALVERTESLIAGNFGKHLVIVPRTFRLFGLLNLEEEHAVHHSPVFAQNAIVRESITYRRRAHF